MGNLVSANETATFSATFSMPELSGSQSIVGRAIVIHSGKDNGAASQPSGASGTMLARCVIGITDKQVILTNVVCPTKEQPVESSTAQPSSAAKVGASNIFYATLILVLLSVVALF
ncbi:Copper/zinc superoxide dismutase (SODC) [compost metagenome]